MLVQIFVKRLLIAVPTLIGVSLFAFVLIRLAPGDPVLTLLGERGGDPKVYQQMKQTLGLDRHPIEQYFLFVKNAIVGDFGRSISDNNKPVLSEFFKLFPATVELGVVGMLIATIVGLPLGIAAAIWRRKFWDYFLMGGALVGYSMPIFWWGLILIIVFSVHLGWTPVSGRMNALYEVNSVTGFMLIDSWFGDDGLATFFEALRHIALPAVALATVPMAAIARMTRSSIIEVLREDYIRTAKAKGVSQYPLVLKHALKNALIPIVTVLGLMFGTILTGAILTETIFSWPGIGKWMVKSVQARDYPVIQGGVVLIAIMVILVNMIVDMIYVIVNPQLRGAK